MSEIKPGLSRRGLFQLAGVATAAAATGGCEERVRRPVGPERNVQTLCGACPAGCGIVVRTVGPQSQDAVRIVGLAGHPVNDGGMCPRGIAEIQNLYHPERLRGPLVLQRATGKHAAIGWDEALAELARRARSSRIVIGLGDVGRAERSVLTALAARLGATVVDARLPYGSPPAQALREMLGSDRWSFDLAHASALVSLGADWLQASPSPVEAQRAFGALRQASQRAWLATADARLSVTAARSDDWIPVARHELPELALSIAHAMLREQPDIERRSPAFAALAKEARFAPAQAAARLGIRARLVERSASALLGGGVVVVDGSDPAVAAAGIALDVLAGAVGRQGGLVPVAEPLPADGAAPATSGAFPASEGATTVLFVGANPLQLAIRDREWQAGLARASAIVSLTSFLDETAAQADFVLPVSTALESRQLTWGATLDGRGFASAGPAAVRPLYDTLEPVEALLRVGRALGADLPWKDAGGWYAGTAETLGAQDLLKKGGAKVLDAPAAPATLPADSGAWAVPILVASLSRSAPAGHPLGLAVHLPLAFPGGTGAHLPYLHGIAQVGGRELWQTAVELHPQAARKLGIADGAPVWVESPAGRVRAVLHLREGIRPDSAAIAVGLGRKALGPFAAGRGSNPLDLLDSAEPAFVTVRRAT